MPRVLTPEILDQLDPNDPDAVRSRGDLQRINRVIGSHRWLDRKLQEFRPKHVVELGAGDGVMARRLSNWKSPTHYTAIDLVPKPAEFPTQFDWIQGDAISELPSVGGDVVIANLFLHHLTDAQLERLGGLLSGFKALLCCEPARIRRNHILGRLLNTLCINHVTRSDMHTSIDAGFRHDELPLTMDLSSHDWRVQTDQTALGIYRMSAIRNSEAS